MSTGDHTSLMLEDRTIIHNNLKENLNAITNLKNHTKVELDTGINRKNIPNVLIIC